MSIPSQVKSVVTIEENYESSNPNSNSGQNSNFNSSHLSDLLHLDQQILMNILIYLPATKLCRICCVCKIFYQSCYRIVTPILRLLCDKHKWIDRLLHDAKATAWSPLRMLHILTSPHIMLIGGNIEPHAVDAIDIRNKLRWFTVSDTLLGREVFFESLWYRGYVYVFCGIHHSSYGQVERYNPLSNKWTTCPSLPGQLAGVLGCVLKGKIYITGGYDWHRMEYSNVVYYTDDFSLLESSEDCWKILDARLTLGRSSHACVAFRGKIWVAGGAAEGQTSEGNQSVEIYDPSLGFWYPGPDLNIKRFRLRLLVVRDVLYAVGGDRDERGRKLIQTIEKLVVDKSTPGNMKPNTHHWIHVTTFKEDRRGFSSAVVGNKIYIIGGRSGDIPLHSWDAYDVRTGKWASDEDENTNHDYSSDQSLAMTQFQEHFHALHQSSSSVAYRYGLPRTIFRSKGMVGTRGVTIPGCAMNW